MKSAKNAFVGKVDGQRLYTVVLRDVNDGELGDLATVRTGWHVYRAAKHQLGWRGRRDGRGRDGEKQGSR